MDSLMNLLTARSTSHPGSKPWFRHRQRPERGLEPVTARVPPRIKYRDPKTPVTPLGTVDRITNYTRQRGSEISAGRPLTGPQHRRITHKRNHAFARGHLRAAGYEAAEMERALPRPMPYLERRPVEIGWTQRAAAGVRRATKGGKRS
jgi:hypothetical protein